MSKEKIMALIDSVDDKSNLDYAILKVNANVLHRYELPNLTVNAYITTNTFDDGSPVIKTFYRNNTKAVFTFEENKEYDVAYDKFHGILYWYQNGIWYLSEQKEEFLIIPHLNKPAN